MQLALPGIPHSYRLWNGRTDAVWTLGELTALLGGLATVISVISVLIGRIWGGYTERTSRDGVVYQRMKEAIEREAKAANEAAESLTKERGTRRKLEEDVDKLTRSQTKLTGEVEELKGMVESLTTQVQNFQSQATADRARIKELETELHEKDVIIKELGEVLEDSRQETLRVAQQRNEAIKQRDEYKQLWADHVKE